MSQMQEIKNKIASITRRYRHTQNTEEVMDLMKKELMDVIQKYVPHARERVYITIKKDNNNDNEERFTVNIGMKASLVSINTTEE